MRGSLPLLVVAMGLGPFAALAAASDWYVDAVQGSDLNDGASPSTAWRTLTHAMALVPPGPGVTVHVAPGVYDAALGEGFPIAIVPDIALVGDQGSAGTILDGGGAAVTLVSIDSNLGGPAFSSATQVRGLTLRNAGSGVHAKTYDTELSPVLADLSIENQSGVGVSVTYEVLSSAWGTTTLSDVRIQGCGGRGLSVAKLTNSSVAVSLTDCSIRSNQGDGVLADVNAGTLDLSFTRCELVSNGGFGVHHASWLGSTNLQFDDSLAAGNAAGIDGLGSATVTARRSTIAHNLGSGIATNLQTLHVVLADLDSCIVYGNGDDLLDPLAVTAHHCDIGDGTLAGTNSNFAADPLFVDPLGGDYRLLWGSPCIESGDPATAPGALDLAGYRRPIDGDLDTLQAPDIGAFEFAPLFRQGTAQLGAPLLFECWGAAGSSTHIWFSRFPLAAVPQATPFGSFELEPLVFGYFRNSPAAPGPPVVVRRRIPNLPELAGRTFSFQALTTSWAAPQGAAYTNAVQLTVLP